MTESPVALPVIRCRQSNGSVIDGLVIATLAELIVVTWLAGLLVIMIVPPPVDGVAELDEESLDEEMFDELDGVVDELDTVTAELVKKDGIVLVGMLGAERLNVALLVSAAVIKVPELGVKTQLVLEIFPLTVAPLTVKVTGLVALGRLQPISVNEGKADPTTPVKTPLYVPKVKAVLLV